MAYLSQSTFSRPSSATRPRLSLREMRALYRQRRHLAQLDDHILRDIGLTREEATSEALKPFWNMPQSWLR